MEEELIEKLPLRKWRQMSPAEQRQEISAFQQSRSFRLMSENLQRMINQIS